MSKAFWEEHSWASEEGDSIRKREEGIGVGVFNRKSKSLCEETEEAPMRIHGDGDFLLGAPNRCL